MTYGNFKPQAQGRTFKRREYIDLSPGQHVIRILTREEDTVAVDTHYVRGTTITCLGEDCPICKNNRIIIMEHPKDFRNVSGYSSRRPIQHINVLDRTPAKVCPNAECNAEVKKVGATFPTNCPKCNAVLTGVKASPLNKVKILSKGREFFDFVGQYNTSILDEDETPIGVTNFDLSVSVIESGGKKTTSPSPLEANRDTVEVDPEALFDLSDATIKLTVDEITDLLRGVRLGDILKARKPVAEEKPEVKSQDKNFDIESSVEELYSN